MAGAYLGYNQARRQRARDAVREMVPQGSDRFRADIGQEYWPERIAGTRSARRCCTTRISASTRQGEPGGLRLPGAGADGDRAVGLSAARGRWILAAGVLAILVAYLFYFTPSAFAGGAVRVGGAAGHDPAGGGRADGRAAARPAVLPIRRRLSRDARGPLACWLAGLGLMLYGVPKAYSAGAGRTGRGAVDAGDPAGRGWPAPRPGQRGGVHPLQALPGQQTDPRWDCYGDGFAHNEPDLRNSVVYAGTWGPQRDAELMKSSRAVCLSHRPVREQESAFRAAGTRRAAAAQTAPIRSRRRRPALTVSP